MTKGTDDLLKEVNYVADSSEMHTLAEFRKNAWFIKGSHGSFKLVNASGNNGEIFELVGDKMVKSRCCSIYSLFLQKICCLNILKDEALTYISFRIAFACKIIGKF